MRCKDFTIIKKGWVSDPKLSLRAIGIAECLNCKELADVPVYELSRDNTKLIHDALHELIDQGYIRDMKCTKAHVEAVLDSLMCSETRTIGVDLNTPDNKSIKFDREITCAVIKALENYIEEE